MRGLCDQVCEVSLQGGERTYYSLSGLICIASKGISGEERRSFILVARCSDVVHTVSYILVDMDTVRLYPYLCIYCT